MASHQEQSDLDRIRAELEHVKLENARLELENEVSCDRPLETAAPDHSSMRRQVPTVVGCNVQTQTDEPRVNNCDVCDITFGNQAMMFVHKGCHCVDNPMKCNVCGETCHDSMGFYIHITMGHTAK
ncbi:hypothetical protein DPMN_111158 [Dreissena polymorpha]|uniref:C2H2-type domain-containing protein n=1 Tax=Dreissena polymorpha TaxID=45954 RepID=A0A9D4KDB8_DREPO|nr:hypothetical protein DPMN_111158 [Dreissena polymorpha]